MKLARKNSAAKIINANVTETTQLPIDPLKTARPFETATINKTDIKGNNLSTGDDGSQIKTATSKIAEKKAAKSKSQNKRDDLAER